MLGDAVSFATVTLEAAEIVEGHHLYTMCGCLCSCGVGPSRAGLKRSGVSKVRGAATALGALCAGLSPGGQVCQRNSSLVCQELKSSNG